MAFLNLFHDHEFIGMSITIITYQKYHGIGIHFSGILAP